MAIVNVDLSEYDAIRKRNSELEEQVKELKAVYQDKERDLREKYASMTGEFEAKRLRILNKLPKIATMATDLRDELNKCFFKPKLAIKLANDIIDSSTKKD